MRKEAFASTGRRWACDALAWALKLPEVRRVSKAPGTKENYPKKLIFINAIVLYNLLEDTQFSLVRAPMSQFVIWYSVAFAVNWKSVNFTKLQWRTTPHFTYLGNEPERNYFIFLFQGCLLSTARAMSSWRSKCTGILWRVKLEFRRFSSFGIWNWNMQSQEVWPS